MERRTFGKTGMQVSALGFGGSEIGYEGTSQAEVERLLHSALDAGLNVIDTGECYADSEEKIGKALARRRNDVFLFTKVGHASGLPFDDWSPGLIRASIDRSLQRLQTDSIDLIQLHTCDADTLRQGDVIVELQNAREAGKVRFIGYSGDGETARLALDLEVFDTFQTSVNIADQQCIELTLPRARELGMGVIAKRPLANVAWRYGSQRATDPYHVVYWERLQELRYGFLEGADAVGHALRFTLAQSVHTAIVGTKNPDRWAKNAALLEGGVLSQGEVGQIRARWAGVAGPDWVGQV